VEDEIKVVCGSPSCPVSVTLPADLTVGQQRAALQRLGWSHWYDHLEDNFIPFCGGCT
jgi:hypothetical protein